MEKIRKKTKLVGFYVEPEELETIQEYSKVTRTPVAIFCRRWVLEKLEKEKKNGNC